MGIICAHLRSSDRVPPLSPSWRRQLSSQNKHQLIVVYSRLCTNLVHPCQSFLSIQSWNTVDSSICIFNRKTCRSWPAAGGIMGTSSAPTDSNGRGLAGGWDEGPSGAGHPHALSSPFLRITFFAACLSPSSFVFRFLLLFSVSFPHWFIFTN